MPCTFMDSKNDVFLTREPIMRRCYFLSVHDSFPMNSRHRSAKFAHHGIFMDFYPSPEQVVPGLAAPVFKNPMGFHELNTSHK